MTIKTRPITPEKKKKLDETFLLFDEKLSDKINKKFAVSYENKFHVLEEKVSGAVTRAGGKP
ncbi:MAG: hypothetical protein A2096_13100 [Spirochaetes bacterium GWF1_41_5]|nr:MAG: hypothetical protein A2096_13100 [Spirochaetes bacterium GWF1_41_5]HBE04623.1 hypothetical protein [Spirochaetia bacterium]